MRGSARLPHHERLGNSREPDFESVATLRIEADSDERIAQFPQRRIGARSL